MITILLLALLFLSACTAENNIIIPQLSVSLDGGNLDGHAINIAENGGQLMVNIESNSSWLAKSNADWITLSKQEGEGNGSITITASAAEQSRSAAVEVYLSSYNQIRSSFDIIQHVTPKEEQPEDNTGSEEEEKPEDNTGDNENEDTPEEDNNDGEKGDDDVNQENPDDGNGDEEENPDDKENKEDAPAEEDKENTEDNPEDETDKEDDKEENPEDNKDSEGNEDDENKDDDNEDPDIDDNEDVDDPDVEDNENEDPDADEDENGAENEDENDNKPDNKEDENDNDEGDGEGNNNEGNNSDKEDNNNSEDEDNNDDNPTPEQPQGAYLMIDKLAQLSAGEYYIGGYQGDALHLATTGINGGHCNTVQYTFTDTGDLTPASETEAVVVTLEKAAKDGYYIRFKEGYLTATAAGPGKLTISDEKSEYWIFSTHTDGGFMLHQSGDIDVQLIISPKAKNGSLLRSIAGDEEGNAIILFRKNE